MNFVLLIKLPYNGASSLTYESDNYSMKKNLLIVAFLVLLAGGALYQFLSRATKSDLPSKKNVFLIVLDTLRADHMGYLGYERATTPNLNRFAQESLSFEYALTAAPWTPPSVASILSGLYVSAHGVMPPDQRKKAKEVLHRLPKDLKTVHKLLKARGYHASAISPNPWITREFGFDEGFDEFKYIHRANADVITDEAIKQLSHRKDPNAPFFFYLHYFDPHNPYEPPEKFRGLFPEKLKSRDYSPETQQIVDLYDGEIRFLDEQLGRLFGFLKEKDLYEDSIIVVVGDHGEQFYERGQLGHGHQLYNEELHVPLIVHSKGLQGKRSVTVSTVDILPTILTLTGTERPSSLPGLSLTDEEGLIQRSGVMAEIRRKFVQHGFINPAGFKLIISSIKGADGNEEDQILLFDSRRDFQEIAPLDDSEKRSELLSKFELLQRYSAKSEDSREDEAVEATDETLEQLRSLGYL